MPGLETSLCWSLGLVVDLLESFSVSGFAKNKDKDYEFSSQVGQYTSSYNTLVVDLLESFSVKNQEKYF